MASSARLTYCVLVLLVYAVGVCLGNIGITWHWYNETVDVYGGYNYVKNSLDMCYRNEPMTQNHDFLTQEIKSLSNAINVEQCLLNPFIFSTMGVNFSTSWSICDTNYDFKVTNLSRTDYKINLHNDVCRANYSSDVSEVLHRLEDDDRYNHSVKTTMEDRYKATKKLYKVIDMIDVIGLPYLFNKSTFNYLGMSGELLLYIGLDNVSTLSQNNYATKKLELGTIDRNKSHETVSYRGASSLLIIIISVVMLGSATIFLVYRYRWKLRYHLYSEAKKPGTQPHDTFVVYLSSCDDVFCDVYVLPNLQKHLGSSHDVICTHIHYRLGHFLINEIDRCIQASSVVVVVVSENYCANSNSKYEFDLALRMRKPIILMFKETVSNTALSASMNISFNTLTSARWKQNKYNGTYKLVGSWKRICSSIKYFHAKRRQKKTRCSWVQNITTNFKTIFCRSNTITNNELLNTCIGFAVYLSFSNKNYDTVHPHVYDALQEVLVERMDDRVKPICTDIYFRLGHFITDELGHCIVRSATVMFVVTKEFCSSNHFLTAIDFAVALSKPILLLYLEPVKDKKLPAKLRSVRNRYYLKNFTGNENEYENEASVWENIGLYIAENVATQHTYVNET